ncbi:hypothetical protein DASB73_002890 [Starmerella bacillaris]|uniref:Flavodoxin-like domain-containing protein n=1 Tax=Starmerella bacillaris TaxID=1247836 RepID=A0AAV5RFC8_STABA|nr:hypothetical protein DASB73_002890 [Starmerella bacillaris]
MVKIAVAIYSTYGHIAKLAESEIAGLKEAGAEVEYFQLPTSESNDASAKLSIPVLTPEKLVEFDGVLFGLPTRYGTHPASFKEFFDASGAQWSTGAFSGKYAGFFISTGTQGGGQESLIRNSVTVLVHHGIIFVPLGYKEVFPQLTNLEEVHGGSSWGAGTFAGPDGSRQPTELELDVAFKQGKSFAEVVSKAGSSKSGAENSTEEDKAFQSEFVDASSTTNAEGENKEAPKETPKETDSAKPVKAPSTPEGDAPVPSTEPKPKTTTPQKKDTSKTGGDSKKESDGCCKFCVVM